MSGVPPFLRQQHAARASLPKVFASGKAKLLPTAGGRRGPDSYRHFSTCSVGDSSPLDLNYFKKKNKSAELENALPAPVPLKVHECFFWTRPPALKKGPRRCRVPHRPLSCSADDCSSLAAGADSALTKKSSCTARQQQEQPGAWYRTRHPMAR